MPERGGHLLEQHVTAAVDPDEVRVGHAHDVDAALPQAGEDRLLAGL